MTKNEFVLCCSLFEKYFKGKSLKEILNDENFVEYKLEQPIYDFITDPRFGTYNSESENASLRRNNDCILYFDDGYLELNAYRNFEDTRIKTVEEFLKLFKIPLEDVV